MNEDDFLLYGGMTPPSPPPVKPRSALESVRIQQEIERKQREMSRLNPQPEVPRYEAQITQQERDLGAQLEEMENRRVAAERREDTEGMSWLDEIGAAAKGARLAGQAVVGGITSPFAELMGIPADKYMQAAMDVPKSKGELARAGQILDVVGRGLDYVGETPVGQAVGALASFPMTPFNAQTDAAITGGMRGLRTGAGLVKKGLQEATQATRGELATPPTGAIQLQAAQAPRGKLGMYSNAEQAALNLPQAKGTGNQFLAQISKTAGVKPAELEWTGLSDFLKDRGDKPVTKAEIEQYLQANKVQVDERQLLMPSEFQARINNEIMPGNESIWASVDPDGDITFKQMEPFSDRYLGEIRRDDLPDDIKSDLDDFLKSYGMAKYSPEDERYENYTTPGGSNYREILLKLPNVGENISFEKWVDKYTAIRSMEDLERDPRLMQQMRDRYKRDVSRLPKEGTFRSGHYDDPNILAHMRVTDRNDADGKKVLFVEEMQSDWGRSGREYGFAEKPSAEVSEYKKLLKDYEQGTLPKDQTGRFEELYAKFGRDFVEKKDNRSPSAPFVQNTEDWLNLSLKRLITDAVNNGYGKVAFINGTQSANRYDLSKQVDGLTYVPSQNTLYAMKGGDQVFKQEDVTPDKLSKYVGKDVSDKLLSAPKTKNLSGTEKQDLSGVDLRVGGEGMKKFYDQIVPNTVNKLLKKLGGGKLDTVQLEDGMEQLGFTITPEMRELVKSQGLPMFAKGGAVTMKKGGVSSAMSGIDAAKQAVKAQRRQERVDKNLQRWSGSEEKPPVYYHATDASKDFTVFDPTKSRSQSKASFFTPDKQFASDWVKADPKMLEAPGRPMRPRVMPSYVRAKNTFDFENPDHVHAVMSNAQLSGALDKEDIANRLSGGDWAVIEDRTIQKAIQDQGFDSFFTKERGTKNIGVFNPGDIKSVFNRGSFSEDLDISKAEGGMVSADQIRERLKNAFNFAGGGSVAKGVSAGIKAAKQAVEEAKPAVSRIDMSYKDVTKRVPELTEAAKKVEAGEMGAEDYATLVGDVKPVEPYGFVPQPATFDDAMRALTENKRPMFGKTSEIQPGERADLRLDIPAYKDHGVWINSIHRSSGPTVYGSVSSVKNATMIGAPEKALKVATGQTPKSPFAVIRGEWNPVDETEAVARAQEYLKSPDWVQVGYDPERAGYFYDRRNRKPVTAAEEVLQIGPLVLAKKPKFAEVKDQKFAEGGQVHPFLARLRGFKKGGIAENIKQGVKAASKEVAAAKKADKPESVIEDWKWRPNAQVTEEVGLKEVPDYIQRGYGEFMQGQQKRAQAGEMGIRDLIKAYTITRSSVNRSGLPRDTATKTGMKLPKTDGLVRPEGAFSEWLGSKQGQNYLKAAGRGEVDEKAIADLQSKFAPFGMASVLADDMRWAVKNAPNLASNLSEMIIGDPQTYRSVSQQLQGIGPAKSGFLGSLVGRGDFPTLDARQLRLHTGAGGAEASKYMRRRGGLGGEQAVGRLAGRQDEMGLEIDPSLSPFYQHLAHHAVWDKVADEQTTHDDLVRAMMGYKDGGEVHLSKGGGDLLERVGKGVKAAQKEVEKQAKKDKYPPKFEPAPAIPKEQIREMAERIAQQTTGEFVRQNPKTTTNPEGISKVQFERMKAVKPNVKYNVPQKDAPIVDIEKYKDYLISGVPGDITPGGVISSQPLGLKPRATQELLGINDVEFDVPVGMYGGSRYGQESVFPEGLEAFWASGLSPARSQQNSVTRFSEAEGGRPVLGMFTRMSRPSSAFSGHLLEGLLQYQKPENLPKKQRKMLEEIIRRGTPKQQFPDFVGFENPEDVVAQAMQSGKLRTHIGNVLTMPSLNKQLGLDPKKGLRSGLDVSAAMTIPELSGLEVGTSGYSVGRMVPGAELMPSAHPTYSHDIPGEFIGRMPYQIPYELAFPRTAHFVRENIPSGELFNTMKGTGMKEQIDQQYIDQIRLYQQYMKALTGRKKGGLASIKKPKVKHGRTIPD